MSKLKKVKKRYLITLMAILLAILSVLLLRTFDIDFERQKTMVEKEMKAIMEFNRDFFSETIVEKTSDEKAKLLRNKFANKISYKKLFDKKADFKNFKYLPDKEIYGFQLINNAHVGFYYNTDNCGNSDEGKDYCAGIILDTNGYTRPNRFGKDQFLFKVYKNKIVE